MNKISEKLKRYFHLKKQLYSYLLMTEEPAKILSAIEELDSLLDFIDVQLELRRYHSSEEVQSQINNQQQNDVFKYLFQERNAIRNKFDNAVEKQMSLLEKNQLLDPLISDYRNQTRAYLKFKKAVNTLRSPKEKQNQLHDIASKFHESYSLLESDNLSFFYDEAVQELQLNLGKGFEQLPSEWSRAVTFCDRTVLENEGLFRTNQEKRHLLFSKMFNQFQERKIDNPDDNFNGQKNSFFISLKKIFTELFLPHKNFEEININALYMTQKLDRYLYSRDLRMNLARKWARFIPLEMSHYLIKFYNDPHYWDDNHLFLADVDYLRLGFSYYQYSMELGKDSESFPMIYKKALSCFLKGKVGLPGELKEKLALE